MCSTRPAAQQGSRLPQRQQCHSSYICLTFYIHTLGNDDYFWTAKYYLKDRQIIYHAFQIGRLLWFPTARTKFASLGYLTISSTKPTGSIREADCPLITAITALPLWKPFFSYNSFWKEGCSSARGLKYPNASCSGLCTNHPVHTIAHYQWAYSNCAAPTQALETFSVQEKKIFKDYFVQPCTDWRISNSSLWRKRTLSPDCSSQGD